MRGLRSAEHGKRGRPAFRALVTAAGMLAAACAAFPPRATLLATVPVGHWPEDVVYDPASDTAFVADEGSATVTAVDVGARSRRGVVSLASRARHLALDPTRGLLFAPEEGDQMVRVIETGALRTVHRIPVGPDPHGIAVDPSLGRLFVAHEGDDTLWGIDIAGWAVAFRVNVPRGPGGVAVDAGRHRVYVVSVKEDLVTILDGGNVEIPGSTLSLGTPGGSTVSETQSATAIDVVSACAGVSSV